MNIRHSILLLILPILMGAVSERPDGTLFLTVSEAIRQDLGTAGEPRHLPLEYFRSRYRDNPALQAALGHYYAQDYHEAFRTLERSEYAGDPESLAWRALICYRQGNYPESVQTARRALALEPDLGLAHLAMGMSHNSQIHTQDWADQDSVVTYVKRAAETAPALTAPWQTLWAEGVKAGDEEMEEGAVRGLWVNDCFTPGLLEYNRWVLASLPKKALLLTNGDADTYPLLALMQAEGLRPDVAVINISMLNLPDYADVVCARAGLPWPRGVEQIEAIQHARDQNGNLHLRATQIIDGWATMYRRGELPRPLVWALTVASSNLPGDLSQHGLILGGCTLYVPEEPRLNADIDAIWQSFQKVDHETLMGNFVSPAETSPVRAAGGNHLAANSISVLIRYGYHCVIVGEPERAREGWELAEELMRLGDMEDSFQEQMEQMWGLLDEGEGQPGG